MTKTLTIDGKSVTLEKPMSVFQAAEKAGISIPHYCYHPDLSVAGVCRMCMVEVEKNPRLQVSCNTQAENGMVVHTKSPKVKEAVKGVLELHLINHPLDCPICDKAGECKLQDYYADLGPYESRMEHDKVRKPKVIDIGTIMLDSERCILCTRCVRFTDEVSKSNELVILGRGDRSELTTVNQKPLHNDYTGNLADICPVGALTAKDFRFQCRVWFLEKTNSICSFCARGCNTSISVNPKTKTLYRVEPRRNTDVNQSWICDTGRWNYSYVYEDRIETPKKRIDGRFIDKTWHDLFCELKEMIAKDTAKVLFALSTQLTQEEIYDAVTNLKEMGATHFTWLVDESAVSEKAPYDGILKHRDLTPNAKGFENVFKLLKGSWLKHEELKELNFSTVFLLGVEGKRDDWIQGFLLHFRREVNVILHASNRIRCSEICEYLIPNVTAFEKSGTFINALGRLQRLTAVIPPQHASRDLHRVLFGLKDGGDRRAPPDEVPKNIFEKYLSEHQLGKAMTWKEIDPLGVQI